MALVSAITRLYNTVFTSPFFSCPFLLGRGRMGGGGGVNFLKYGINKADENSRHQHVLALRALCLFFAFRLFCFLFFLKDGI